MRIGMRMNRHLYFTAAAFLLSLSVIILETITTSFPGKEIVILVLLFMIPAAFLAEMGIRLWTSLRKSLFIQRNIADFALLAIFLIVFITTAWLSFSTGNEGYRVISLILILVRNGYLLAYRLAKMRKFAAFIGSFSRHPAQTLVLSFFIVILSGTILLMLPFATVDKAGLSPIDAFFTATSAVCVTGLIVVDTATAFTVWGKIVILVLIQLGGLGIMLSSYFIIFFFRRSMSVEEKLLISYMLSENDMTRLRHTLMRHRVNHLHNRKPRCARSLSVVLRKVSFGTREHSLQCIPFRIRLL